MRPWSPFFLSNPQPFQQLPFFLLLRGMSLPSFEFDVFLFNVVGEFGAERHTSRTHSKKICLPPPPGDSHCLRSLRRHCGLVTSFAARTLPWSGLQVTLEGPFQGEASAEQTTSRGVNRLNTPSAARAGIAGAAGAHALTPGRRSARLRGSLEARRKMAAVPAARPAVGLFFSRGGFPRPEWGQRARGHMATVPFN